MDKWCLVLLKRLISIYQAFESKCQNRVTQGVRQEVPSNILPAPTVWDSVSPRRSLPLKVREGLGQWTLGWQVSKGHLQPLSPQMDPVKEAENASSNFPCPARGLEACRCWERPGLFTLSSEKSTAMRQEPGGDRTLGALLKLSLGHAEDTSVSSRF